MNVTSLRPYMKKPPKLAFEIGDMVYLKTPSPIMTVQYVGEADVRTCWFDDRGLVQVGNFHPKTLYKKGTRK